MEILIVMVLVLVVLYVVTIRPQRQRQMQQQAMIDAAGVGDDVLTQGGIYGTITQAEGDDVVVELGKGLEVHMTRRGIAAVLPPEEEEEEEEEVADADENDVVTEGHAPAAEVEPDDEASVSTEEEPVTSGVEADPAAADRR